MHPPFRVNIAGVVADVSEVQPCQVTIRKSGCDAEDVEMQRQRNIVLYFVSGFRSRLKRFARELDADEANRYCCATNIIYSIS